eukprot:2574154-Pleurochrysis_carterae.AAC.4
MGARAAAIIGEGPKASWREGKRSRGGAKTGHNGERQLKPIKSNPSNQKILRMRLDAHDA